MNFGGGFYQGGTGSAAANQSAEEAKRAAMIAQLMQHGPPTGGAAGGAANALRMGAADAMNGYAAQQMQQAQNLGQGGAYQPWTAQVAPADGSPGGFQPTPAGGPGGAMGDLAGGPGGGAPNIPPPPTDGSKAPMRSPMGGTSINVPQIQFGANGQPMRPSSFQPPGIGGLGR